MRTSLRTYSATIARLGILLTLVLLPPLAHTQEVPAGAPPNILFVDPAGLCGGRTPCFTGVQLAINAAGAGDAVVVGPGRYTEHVDFLGKAIIVVSEHGPLVTVIDGLVTGSVVTFAHGEGPSSVLVGFTLQNGVASLNGGGVNIQSASPTILGNIITRNGYCNGGGGIGVSFGSPLIAFNWITRNFQSGCTGGIGGGGISIGGASHPAIIANAILGNSSNSGGGISLFAAGDPVLFDNFLAGNTASSEGGAISMGNRSDADVIQNLIVYNSAGQGGGIAALVPSGARGPLLVNNTVASNNSPQGSGAFIDGFDDQTRVINNVIVGAAGQAAVFCGTFTTSAPVFGSNDVFSSGGTAYAGNCTDQTGLNGNISADPQFVSPATLDYRLQSSSPAIDAGDNTAPMLPPTDLNRDPRIVNGVVDMGAYEFQGSGAASSSSAESHALSEALRLLDQARTAYQRAERVKEAARAQVR
jgi:serine protease